MSASDIFRFDRYLERLKEASWWPIETSDTTVQENPALEARLLGHICRSARGLLGLSQNDLADAAGISRKTVLAVEGGYGQPDIKTVLALKAALLEKGISVDLNAKQLFVSVPLERIDLHVAQSLSLDEAAARNENQKRMHQLIRGILSRRSRQEQSAG